MAENPLDLQSTESRPNLVTIPPDLEDTLFFMYVNGMTYADIVKYYEKSSHPFTKEQLQRFAYRKGWNARKKAINDDIKKDFKDVLLVCQSKKMTAISMAIQAVSDMIIKEVADFRADPDRFWIEVANHVRPRPFWMAKNVEELTKLYQLQKFLEVSAIPDETGDVLSEGEYNEVYGALAEATKIQDDKITEETALIEAPKHLDAIDAVLSQDEPTVEELSQAAEKLINNTKNLDTLDEDRQTKTPEVPGLPD